MEGVKGAWILGINALGVFHEQREDILSLLKKGGNVRVLLLDPESEVFKDRERKEEEINGQISGRLRAEYTASVAYCKDLFSEDVPPTFLDNLRGAFPL